MKTFSRTLLACFAGVLMVTSQARAEDPGEALGTCISSSTTGKDRVEVAKWIFEIMTLHPQIHVMASITPEQRLAGNQTMAKLVTRLLTTDCLKETKDIRKANGDGLEQAFTVLGKMAINELMSHPSVVAANTEFAKYLDTNAIQGALK